MQIKLYNSLNKSVDEFKPIHGNEVRMYSCGPTVYNYAHIGNMRAFLFADLLQRTLRVVGEHDVKWVMNITNIDDKTIRDSQKGSDAWLSDMGEQTNNPIENLLMLTKFYENSFVDDINKLGIDSSHFFSMPKATEYIPQMQELIRAIVEKGIGYVSEGSVYFDVNEWRKRDIYGKLFKIDFDNFRAGVRIDSDQYEREQASDFVLWKAKKDGEPYWDFDINGENCPGRPGWHIECSAMEYELLGLPFDIHTGGVDLKFPHHEDEIAQSKAGYGIEPTVFWCHNEFLEVEGEKMSKSLGNFFTLRDLMEKGVDPIDIRFAMFSAHYASKFNFTFDGISAARKARFRIQEYIYELLNRNISAQDIKSELIEKLCDSVFAELANDLHTPKALAALFSFMNNNNAKNLDEKDVIPMLNFLKQMNDIFAAWSFEPKEEIIEEIPEEVNALAEARWNAKQSKNWAEADVLRQKISDLGYTVKDKKDGYDLIKN